MRVLLLAQAEVTVDTPPIVWSALSPFLVMVGGSILLLLLGGLLPRKQRIAWGALTTVAIALGTIVAAVLLWRDLPESGTRSVVAGAYAVDGFSLFLIIVIAVGVIIAALLTDGYMRREELDGPEAYILYVVSAAGGIIMASAGDLIVLFLGLEILSIAAYVLAGLHRRRLRSGEAALKYFVLGGFSSAFFLYGIALIYGATGSTNMAKIADFLAENRLADEGLLLAGIGLMLVGFGFKVAAAPFHLWTPDVYQGSPSPVVSFMATAVKAAGFAGMLRVLVVTFETHRLDWQPIIYALAVASLVVGATLAVVQTDVKRMMAYSSINHAGFMLIAVATGTLDGVSAVLFYLAAYTVMVGGTFGVITVVGRKGDARHSLDDYAGLARREPLLAFSLTVFLLAQAGTPLTSGFLAKFYAVNAVVEAGSFWLGLVAMLTAVISAFLYLRIVLSMYAGTDDASADEAAAVEAPVRRIQVPLLAKITIGLALVATVGLGIVPDPLTKTARDATPDLIAEVPSGAEAEAPAGP
ncbi:MAG TPA: NADH-quinone oxidoreductase subunit N [Iamia sp.]|jgi:NADH-quinone oxidoreductase subunit N|nr:NADH-quinone oxidoreductase subunit N [Iamia sp.]